jgi:hypothetical protein
LQSTAFLDATECGSALFPPTVDITQNTYDTD